MTKTLTEQQIRKIIEKGTFKAAKVCEKKFYGKPKSLTEQWRDGTLPAGLYYCKLYYNGFKEKIQECVKSAYLPKSCIPMSCGCEGEEVLAPVPSYQTWKTIIDGDRGTLEHLKKILPMIEYNRVAYDYLKKVIEDMEKDIKEVK